MTDPYADPYAAAADLLDALPDLIRARRKALALSQQQFADIVGTQQSAVSDWESRRTGMTAATAAALLRWVARAEEQVIEAFLDRVARQAAALGLEANIVASLANGTAEIQISRTGPMDGQP